MFKYNVVNWKLALARSASGKYIFMWHLSLYAKYRDAEENRNQVQVLDLNTDLIISERTLKVMKKCGKKCAKAEG